MLRFTSHGAMRRSAQMSAGPARFAAPPLSSSQRLAMSVHAYFHQHSSITTTPRLGSDAAHRGSPAAHADSPSSILPVDDFRATRLRAKKQPLLQRRKKLTAKERADEGQLLTVFHPGIAGGMITFVGNRLTQAAHTPINSLKLAVWRCAKCDHKFRRRVRDHVALNGECPECHFAPRANQQYKPLDISVTNGNIGPDGNIEGCGRKSAYNSVATNAGMQQSHENRQHEPMLAVEWKKHERHLDDATDNLMWSPKLDGIRCIVAYDAVRRTPVFFSRKGVELQSCDHLIGYLQPLFDADPTLMLDGELYNHNVFRDDFQTLAGIARTTRNSPRTKNKKNVNDKEFLAKQKAVQYHVFDVMYAAPLLKTFGEDIPFNVRHRFIREVVATAVQQPHSIASVATRSALQDSIKYSCADAPIQVVPALPLASKQNVDAHLEEALRAGYEGVMVRRVDAAYQFGKRNKNLLKYKKFSDSEYKVVSAVEGKGRLKNSLGAFVCEISESGPKFSVSPSVPEAMKRKMWRNRASYPGKVLTVQFQDLSSDGIPRFPIGKCIRGSVDGSDWM